jgi:hypothetical protein
MIIMCGLDFLIISSVVGAIVGIVTVRLLSKKKEINNVTAS